MNWPTFYHLQLPSLKGQEEVLFLSDLHLGVLKGKTEQLRECAWVELLRSREERLKALFLLGDIFDFWFEYREVVPRGLLRLQACLAEISDRGTPVHFFTGNHDLWSGNYFRNELGLHLHRQPVSVSIGEVHLYMAHGDGLGSGDTLYKIYKRLAVCSFFQLLFRSLHPDLGVRFARWLSRSKRFRNMSKDFTSFSTNDLDTANTRLQTYATELTKQYPKMYTYYLFGHTHVAKRCKLLDDSYYINLGGGLCSPTYGRLDSQGHLSLHSDESLIPIATVPK